jgi:hypothetical protein
VVCQKDEPSKWVRWAFANLTGEIALNMAIEAPNRYIVIKFDGRALFEDGLVMCCRKEGENRVVRAVDKIPDGQCNKEDNDSK